MISRALRAQFGDFNKKILENPKCEITKEIEIFNIGRIFFRESPLITRLKGGNSDDTRTKNRLDTLNFYRFKIKHIKHIRNCVTCLLALEVNDLNGALN